MCPFPPQSASAAPSASSSSSAFGLYDAKAEIERIEKDWNENSRWSGVLRPYTAADVVRLRGSIQEINVFANRMADVFWRLIKGEAKKGYVNALGALTGGQAVQMAKAGLEAIYLSGWQIAADNNSSLSMYPDQSLYSVDSIPKLIKTVNNSLRRADQIQWAKGVTRDDPSFIDYLNVPVVADAEAGFGGVLNAYELCRSMIEAGAGGLHLEDQLSSAKKCGHLGGKVLVPATEAIHKLVAARLAADVAGVPTVIIARTDADSATLLTSDWDKLDHPFLTGKRTSDGYFVVNAGLKQAIARGLLYAPYCDMIWCETSTPNLEEAKMFAKSIHSKYPNKALAYNCSPSFNWKLLSPEEVGSFQERLSDLGYTFQFITLAGIHSIWYNMFNLASCYSKGEGVKHYVDLVQQPEFQAQKEGYTFVAHQQEVGVGYFDDLASVVMGSDFCNTGGMRGSTEEEQF